MRKSNVIVSFLLALAIALCGCTAVQKHDSKTDVIGIERQTEIGQQEQIEEHVEQETDVEPNKKRDQGTDSFDMLSIPAYSGNAYIAINNNTPYFTKNDMTTNSFERYAPLDSLGRCGVAYANIGRDIMPTEERGSIGMVKPSGWHSIRYENVDGKYLYNRCHLIGYQLSAENANTSNLITGTRYLNIQGCCHLKIWLLTM